MDNLNAFGPQEPQGIDDVEEDAGIEAPPEIGTDERRMHVRAYNYWASLLRDRAYPSIEDLDPESIEDFGPNSVLLDFTAGVGNPTIAWLGASLRQECDIASDIESVSDVPSRSLLSRLTDHYMQIIANQAPVGFEAEFVNERGTNMLYRGILMPFSSDDDTIDFIYGVINWKEGVDAATEDQLREEVSRSAKATRPSAPAPVWADGPSGEAPAEPRRKTPAIEPVEYEPEEAAETEASEETVTAVEFDAEPESLFDYLVLARASADEAKAANRRSRAALYEALGCAYDFALGIDDEPEAYAELLEDAGIVAQERAPMTPVAKLVFGVDYDKTRLTEFSAALSHAKREGVEAGTFAAYLQDYDGGLKAVVAAERAARRPDSKTDPIEELYAQLREAKIEDFATLDDHESCPEEFTLLMTRCMPNGRYAVIGAVPHDKALVERAMRKFASR